MGRQIHVYYAGSVIVAALLIGGGTTQALWTDTLLEMLLLPCLLLGTFHLFQTRLDTLTRIFVALVLVALAAQFIPMMRAFPVEYEGGPGSQLAFWTLSVDRSVSSALFTLSVVSFGVYVSRFTDKDQLKLVWFFGFGFLLNLLIALIQLSFSGESNIIGPLPFKVTTGLFANANHFSSLVYAMIPLIAAQFLSVNRRPVFYWASITLIIFVLVAVNSRAAIAISLVVSIVSFIWFFFKTPMILKKAFIAIAPIFAVAIFVLIIAESNPLDEGLRTNFFRNTLNAVGFYLPFGSGLGTFEMVYPGFEQQDEIVLYFANHAHNDFLEIGVELGLAGLGLIVFYYVLIARNFARSPFSEAATISIIALSLHSVVDYPLRTMALALLFSFLSAIVLSRAPHSEEQNNYVLPA